MQDKPKVIIDTDAGHDDALAMMLLLLSGKIDVLAITTVAGNSTIDKVTRNARAVLDLIHDTTTPLHSGAAAPLERELIVAEVHGESGIDGLDVTKTSYELTNDAVPVIKSYIEKYPGEISLVTLGPLTNIACLLQENPGIEQNIQKCVIMGGAIEAPGNKNRVAEFNFYVDPDAAKVVVDSSVQKVLVPLDPCNDIRIQLESFGALEGKKLYEPLMSMMRHFIAGIQKFEKVNAALVYDALAAYYMITPSAFQLEKMDMVVETKGEYTAGMSVVDRRAYSSKHPNVEVATKINAKQFETDLIAALKNAV